MNIIRRRLELIKNVIIKLRKKINPIDDGSIEFGGNDLLHVYNSAQLKHRLNTAGLYVACTKQTGFSIEITNADSSTVMVGVRVLVGTRDVQRAPSYVEVFGRFLSSCSDTAGSTSRWLRKNACKPIRNWSWRLVHPTTPRESPLWIPSIFTAKRKKRSDGRMMQTTSCSKESLQERYWQVELELPVRNCHFIDINIILYI